MVKEIDIVRRNIGVNFKDQIAEITVWAPKAEKVVLHIVNQELEIEMLAEPFGYWYLETDQLLPGEQYIFELRNEEGKTFRRADPASLMQADGVDGASTAFQMSSFPWTDHSWKGQPLESYIIYELHVGTFSQEGNFLGIEQKLDYLIGVGVTAIEIMPIAAFPGQRNWGYDGVFPFAIQSSYGGALGLQNLVNACHQKGLSVILDVVYNHFGPEGNFMSDFAPFFTDKYHTPWGDAINFDDAYCDGVRNFYIENVLMWFRDFHIDALRLDAVHAIKDFGAKHILQEIGEYVQHLGTQNGRDYHLIIECDLNDTKYINPTIKNGFGMHAQWCDEFHHALRVAAGQKRDGYYKDFNGVSHLAKSYLDAYVYDGLYSPERKKTFGSKASGNRGEQFIVFSQNHDQVGNRMLGERTSTLYSFELLKVLAGAVCISPFVPLFFMGEEYGETNPFLYFIHHNDPKLIKAVRNGRRAEFAAFHSEGQAPDPQSEQTFLQSKLQWDLISQPQHQQLLSFYSSLISTRKTNAVLKSLDREKVNAYPFEDQNCLVLHRFNEEEQLLCLLNFSNQKQDIFVDLPPAKWLKFFDSEDRKWGRQEPNLDTIDTTNKILLQAETFIIYQRKNG